MKRRNKKYFTLIELLFVIAILVILIGISWVAGTKVLRNQTEKKTKAEILLLSHAVKQYKDRWGSYPHAFAGNNKAAAGLDFAHLLSKVLPDTGWSSEKRPMFIDYKQADFFVGTWSGTAATIDYSKVDHSSDCSITDQIYAFDPYENPYMYAYYKDTDSFIIYSKGLDGDSTDPGAGAAYDKTQSLNLDNITSDDL